MKKRMVIFKEHGNFWFHEGCHCGGGLLIPLKDCDANGNITAFHNSYAAFADGIEKYAEVRDTGEIIKNGKLIGHSGQLVFFTIPPTSKRKPPMDIQETIEKLRATANYLEGLQAKLTMPVQECNVMEVFGKHRVVLGDNTYITVHVEFGQFKAGGEVSVEWNIYTSTGGERFKGRTLKQALNACLAAYAPKTPSAAVEEIKMVETVLSEPEPF